MPTGGARRLGKQGIEHNTSLLYMSTHTRNRFTDSVQLRFLRQTRVQSRSRPIHMDGAMRRLEEICRRIRGD